MSDVQSCVGMVTAGNLSTYDVRVITKGRSADNKAYVSSKTAGKNFRVAGNADATWEISLYAKANMEHIPAVLQPGQQISITAPSAPAEVMIIDSASLEVDIEAGELVGISLSCSAVAATSYVDNP